MRGLTLRITNTSSTRVAIADIDGSVSLALGESVELLYTSDVQQSLEYGTINALLTSRVLTAQFISGSLLSQAPIGSTLVGATPTLAGIRGLVPTPATTDRTKYLKGDGSWSTVSAFSVGAIPENILTSQGDLIVRGVTKAERLPLGTLGQVLRSGVVQVEWVDAVDSGLLADIPTPASYNAGRFYWATDVSKLYVCYYNGATYAWWDFAGGSGGGAWDTFPTGGVPSFVVDVTHIGRAAVGVDPGSSIPVGIQFQVLGASLFTRTFIEQTWAPDPDQAGSTQLRGELTDKGLYSKPDGYSERRVDLPGLARKTIPTPEDIIIPDGSQYICAGVFTLQGIATITLQGDADLVVL